MDISRTRAQLCFILVLFFMTFFFVSCKSSNKMLTNEQVKENAQKYVLQKLNSNFPDNALTVKDIDVFPDREKSNEKESFYNVDGTVENLRLENRIIKNARFNFVFVLKNKNYSISSKTSKITIVADDDISEDVIISIIDENIKKSYGNPLYIKHENDDKQYFADCQEILVKSTIILEKYIVYLNSKIAYKEIEYSDNSEFNLITGDWYLKAANEIWSAEIPNQNNIQKLDELKDYIYSYLHNQIQKNEGKTKLLNSFLFFKLSGIESVNSVTPNEANEENCEFNINLNYKMVRPDFWNGDLKYVVSVDAILKYGVDNKMWSYYSNADVIDYFKINEPDKGFFENIYEHISIVVFAFFIVLIIVLGIFLIIKRFVN